MKHWSDFGDDPNSNSQLARRLKSINEARFDRLVDDRVTYICDRCVDREVLDVGVVEHQIKASHRDNWLHGRLKKVARRLVGVDIIESGVRNLLDRGFDVRLMDITKQALDDSFDVIVVGDVIEHVGDPQGLLNNCYRMLSNDGVLIITTPNPWYINPIIKNLVGKTGFSDSVDHVAWYEPGVLTELGQRSGLNLSRFLGIRPPISGSMIARWVFRLRPILILFGIRREVFSKTLIYEFVR